MSHWGWDLTSPRSPLGTQNTSQGKEKGEEGKLEPILHPKETLFSSRRKWVLPWIGKIVSYWQKDVRVWELIKLNYRESVGPACLSLRSKMTLGVIIWASGQELVRCCSLMLYSGLWVWHRAKHIASGQALASSEWKKKWCHYGRGRLVWPQTPNFLALPLLPSSHSEVEDESAMYLEHSNGNRHFVFPLLTSW